MVVSNRIKKQRRIERRRQTTQFGRMMIANFLSTRAKIAEDRSGSCGIDPPGRDLDYECGYPNIPDMTMYRRLYRREAYAKRANDVWPDECWAVRPEIYEVEDETVTKFERAWRKLLKKINVWHYLHRADKICGLGRYGVILLGFDDGKSLDKPVAGINRRGEASKRNPKKDVQLVYLRPFAEENVEIIEKEMDRGNPRYGQPRYYQIRTQTPESWSIESEQYETLRVHWTRIIHVADNCECDDLYGVPRLEIVLNRLLDIRKVLSGSAEMFWKGAFPGYSFESIPELVGESVINEDTIREQFEEYMEGLKRYMAFDGVTVKQLFPQVADPTKHVMEQVAAICVALQIPLRIFLGSEAGHLASTQDAGTWNKRVAQRQTLTIEQMLIRPLIDRLILVGALPEPESSISWKDLNIVSDKDKSAVALQRAQALMQYASGKCETIMPPYQFFTLILGLTEDEARAVMDAVDSTPDASMKTDPFGEKTAKIQAKINPAGAKSFPAVKPQGGGRKGNPGRKSAGRPRGDIQRNQKQLAV